MTLDQYLAWVWERLPKDIPDEIMQKSLKLGGYIGSAVLDVWRKRSR